MLEHFTDCRHGATAPAQCAARVKAVVRMAGKGLLVGASQDLFDASTGAAATSSLAAELLALVKVNTDNKSDTRRLEQGLRQIKLATQVRTPHTNRSPVVAPSTTVRSQCGGPARAIRRRATSGQTAGPTTQTLYHAPPRTHYNIQPLPPAARMLPPLRRRVPG